MVLEAEIDGSRDYSTFFSGRSWGRWQQRLHTVQSLVVEAEIGGGAYFGKAVDVDGSNDYSTVFGCGSKDRW